MDANSSSTVALRYQTTVRVSTMPAAKSCTCSGARNAADQLPERFGVA
jgi:hypothetical protein